MEVEKRGLKGGFLQLFDWTGKSRKKLFSNKSELPEGSKQGKENLTNLGTSRIRVTEVDENGASSSNKGSSDYNYASSVTSDEGYGSRPAGVVARLMGLDSLPTSNACEPCSTPFVDPHSLGDSCCHQCNTDFHSEQHSMIYSNMCNGLEGFSKNPLKSKPQKMQSRPIERFQTETLPPKSAKSILATHHKLLSPIKNPGFIPTNNAAYIMEAAAKIPGPQTTTRSKMPSFGSSSVPVRIRDLKEKMEAAQRTTRPQRTKEIGGAKYTKGQPLNKNNNRFNGSEYAPQLKASIDSGNSSSVNLKNMGKSISLAMQAKVNVQRREGLASSSNRSSMSQKEHNEVKSNQFVKSRPSTQTGNQKRTSTKTTSVALRENNQKQNCVSSKDKVTLKSSVSNPQARKSLTTNSSFGPNKTINKVVLNSESRSKKIGLPANETEKDLSSSKAKNSSRRKRSNNGNFHFEERVSDNVWISRDDRSGRGHAAVDGCLTWGADDRKNDMEVVSFTFTSPMKRSVPGSQASGQAMENNVSFGVDSHGQNDPPDPKISKISSLGLNVVGGDALSILLEQKLKELTYKIESSQCSLAETGPVASSASSLLDSINSFNVVSTTSMENDRTVQVGMPKDKSDSHYDSDCSSIDDLVLRAYRKWQGFEGMEEHCSHSESSEPRKELDSQHISEEASSSDPPFPSESCCSTVGRNNNCTNGGKQCTMPQHREVANSISTIKSEPVKCETNLSNLAFSSSIEDMGLADFIRPTNWELAYVSDILGNAELIVEGFALGEACNVITSSLFDQLENQETETERNVEDYSKLERKILFDCVSECLDFRIERLSTGSCKAWAKRAVLLQSKGWLAEELYKEISGLRSMGDLMVDELVDKDMSTQHGRWLDFETQVFEEGVEIEKEILDFLVYELVVDLLF